MTTLLCMTLLAAPAAELHVSPAGRDTNPGTAARPFASLAKAQEAVRAKLKAGLTVDLAVQLAAGTYELSEPLVFTPADGGTEAHAVTWSAAPGATVVVSGGRRVAGWQAAGNGLWTAQIPDLDPDWSPRQLFINGRRAIRARWPNADAQPAYRAVKAASLADDRSTYTVTIDPADAKAWGNLNQVELVVCGNWEITRKKLQAVDPATGVLTLAPPHAGSHDAIRPAPGRFYFVENARELLDAPGEWYLDPATGTVTYQPRPGEDMTQAVTVVPRLTRLLEVTGTPANPVRNLHFRGLRFAHAEWAFPAFGFNGTQASCMTYPKEGQHGWEWFPWQVVEPAVAWQYAAGCSLEDGALELLGGVGMRVLKGCHDNRIAGNVVRDIGCSGIMVGENLVDFAWSKEKLPDGDLPRDNRVENNLVTRCGLDDYGAVGIWVSFTDHTVVAHNLLYDLPYTGISVGWMWDEQATANQNNVVEANHVHGVLHKLCDGGCLYTLGWQPGTVIRGNLFHDAARSETAQGAPNNGIFFDQGSKGFHVEGNLIYGTSGEPIRFNQCAQDWHTWADNRFIAAAPEDLAEVEARAGLEPAYRQRLEAEARAGGWEPRPT